MPKGKRPFSEVAAESAEQGRELVNLLTDAGGSYLALLTELHLCDTDDASPGDRIITVDFELLPLEWCNIQARTDVGVDGDRPAKISRTGKTPVVPYTSLVIEEQASSKITAALGIESLEKEMEGTWFSVKFDGNGHNVQCVWSCSPTAGGVSESMEFFLPSNLSGVPVLAWVQNWLSSLFVVSRYFEVDVAREVVEAAAGDRISAIGVMDVGSASCNLLYNAAGVPKVYYDVGTPTFTNSSTAPPAIYRPGPDLVDRPIVVLSHWHADHYGMVINSDNRAELQALQWIIPGGQATPGGVNLSNGLNVVLPIVIPANVPEFSVNNITLLRGDGHAFNDNGIVMVVDITPENVGNAGKAILTGDGMFQYIRLPVNIDIRWIVAAHHGSKTKLTELSIPNNLSGNGRIAYSYGIKPDGNHPYKHANEGAVYWYRTRGWREEAITAETVPPGPSSGPNTVPTTTRGNIMMCNHVTPNTTSLQFPFGVFLKNLY